MPKIRIDAPAARRAPCPAAGQRPCALDLRMAPWAIAHERQQLPAAARIVAVMGVTAIRVRAARLDLEAPPVAPPTVLPDQLRGAMAARARRREGRLELVERLVRAAPRTGEHRLGNRSGAVAAFVARVEHLAVLALELTEQHLLPQHGILGAVAALRAALLLRRAVPQPLELLVHRDRVLVAVLRTHGDGLAQPVDELRLEL